MIIGYSTQIIEQIDINLPTPCPKCSSTNYLLNIRENYAGGLVIISMTKIHAEVCCVNCQKKLAKKHWPHDIQSLAEAKKNEYKPSWLQRGGKLLLVAVLVLAFFAYLIISSVIEQRNATQRARTNFAYAYSDDKNTWYQGLQVGDFILCNKIYYDSAQVFRISEMNENIVVLDAFDQFIPTDAYSELDALNKLQLGQGNSKKIYVKKQYFLRGILEEASDKVGGRNNIYIKQIKKA